MHTALRLSILLWTISLLTACGSRETDEAEPPIVPPNATPVTLSLIADPDLYLSLIHI